MTTASSERVSRAALTLFLSLFAAQAAVIALTPVLAEVADDFDVATATAGRGIGLEQLFDNRAVIDGGNGPAGVVGKRDVRIDTENAEDRVMDVARIHRPILRRLT